MVPQISTLSVLRKSFKKFLKTLRKDPGPTETSRNHPIIIILSHLTNIHNQIHQNIDTREIRFHQKLAQSTG